MAENDREEGPDGHYQPWLRNQAGAAQDGVNRPAPLPTKGGQAHHGGQAQDDAPRAREMSADELLARPIFIPAPTPPGPTFGARMGDAVDGLLQWLRRANEKADIPARIARLELGRRFNTAARISGKALGKAASASGEAIGKAASASGEALGKAASASGEALSKAAATSAQALSSGAAKTGEATKSALSAAGRAAERVGDATGPRIKSAAAGARDGLNNGAAKAAELTRKVGEAAPSAMIDPKAGEAPGSQLDRLLAEEEALEAEREAARAAEPHAAPMVPGLPLFAEANSSAPPSRPAEPARPAAPIAKQVQTDNPSPILAESPATKPTITMPDITMPNVKLPTVNLSALSPRNWRMPDGMAAWARYPATWVLGGVALLGLGFSGGLLWNGGDGASVRAYLLEHPEVLPEAMDRLQAREAAANVNRLRAEIERPFSGAWAGAADGDVTLTVFTDYACTFCRASVPDIERLLREDRRLKIVFREMPILSPDSEAAARLALVAAKRGHYMPVHRALFASANPNAAARSAAATRYDVPNDSAALNNAAITRELQDNIALARQLNFDGTPSWVVGDEVMNGAQGYDKLREAIARARAAS